MNIITYEDIIFVMKHDGEFLEKMLTVQFCKELKTSFPSYDKDLEDYLFFSSCKLGNMKVAKYMASEIKGTDRYWKVLDAGLNWAVDFRNYKLAYFLLEKNADFTNSFNYSVKKAAEDGKLKFLKAVKEKCNNFDFAFEEQTLLKIALLSKDSNAKTIKFLIENGCCDQVLLNRALEKFIMEDNVPMVNFLVENGADPASCMFSYVKYVYR